MTNITLRSIRVSTTMAVFGIRDHNFTEAPAVAVAKTWHMRKQLEVSRPRLIVGADPGGEAHARRLVDPHDLLLACSLKEF